VPVAGDLPSGRLVFFFSDVEGSTRLITELGDGYPALHAEHQRLVRSALATHGGLEISTEGDSFFVVFRSAVDAVTAAAEVQRSLAAHGWPAGHEFRVRIGLHIGQAVLAGDNYVGIDVNRAARVANAANGGQVILTDETARELEGRLPGGVGMSDLGRHRLKDIGVAHLWQLEIHGLAVQTARLRTLDAHPTNLPAHTTPKVELVREADELRHLIRQHRLVTVTGTGGVGKSRLAVQAARDLVADFPDGVFYLDLAPIDRLDTAVMELCALLDIRLSARLDAADALLEHLRDRRILLVLETADRLPELARLAARIAENCPSTRVLVTGRSALRLRAEREFPVQPLALPPPRPSLDVAMESPGVELVVGRGQAANAQFALDSANVEAVTGIVTRLDGIPLALELAAAALRLLSPAAILDRLTRSLPLPRGGAVDAPARQRTLRDTIAWSYELFAEADQGMLRRLSMFATDFALEDVEAVAADPTAAGLDDELESMARLVDGGLVQRVDTLGDARFRLLGIVREFASAELVAAGEEPDLRVRYVRHWLDVAARQSEFIDGPGEMDALRSLDRNADDFRSALEWSISGHREEHLALRLATTLARSWYLRGRVHEAASWLERALAADSGSDRNLRAGALHWLGVMYDEIRDDRRAIESLQEALAIQREIGNTGAVARELNSLGVVHRNIGDLARADTLLNECLALRRESADAGGVATVLTNLGILSIDRGRLDEAVGQLREALEIDRRSGATGVVAYSSSALGTALLRSGRRDEALALLRSGLTSFHELGDVDGVAEGLERLGEAAAPDDPGRAARLVLAARHIRQRERLALRAADEAHANAVLDDAVAKLSPDDLASAQADAEGMDVDAAVAFAHARS
jgi:predicted ATPase/class 3 adenylate cyclase